VLSEREQGRGGSGCSGYPVGGGSRSPGHESDGGGEDAWAAAGDADGMAITERRIRTYLHGEVSPATPRARTAASPSMGFPTSGNPEVRLIACSCCHRVLRDGEWVQPEAAILALRTFEYELPPRFESVLCAICTLSNHVRRAGTRVPRRADLLAPRDR
jgi:hypothetical protein